MMMPEGHRPGLRCLPVVRSAHLEGEGVMAKHLQVCDLVFGDSFARTIR